MYYRTMHSDGSLIPIPLNEEGVVLFIDKPVDWTSFDVIKRIRGIVRQRKVGHAGTLDPKATGLLIVCTGRQTKQINKYVGLEKEYVGILELGVKTPSFDSETEVIDRHEYSMISEMDIVSEAKKFIGENLQEPPMYSAAKYGGKPLYKFAREGKNVQRAARKISITQFECPNIHLPFIDFHIVCSKGTYVRALVHDFGLKLGCGATLRALRRTRIGDYHVEDAMTLEQLSAMVTSN